MVVKKNNLWKKIVLKKIMVVELLGSMVYS